MPYHTTSRISKTEKIARIINVSRRLHGSQVTNGLEVIVSCGDMVAWESVIKYLRF
jgi:hypothetical protein